MKLDVIFEDNHLLVVNKPSGLVTMGADPTGPDPRLTLHSLAGAYLKQKYDKPHGVYVGIVSRLDAMTSGVIVLARTSKAAARLNAQFAAKSQNATTSGSSETSNSGGLLKSYLAIVQAEPNRSARLPEHSVWSDFIYKDDDAHRMRTCRQPRSDAKPAELSFHVQRRDDAVERRGGTLVRVLPLTGRKHQIRVQFASRGFPILGDVKYGSTFPWGDGIALHSESMTIQHPTLKTSMTFECRPPKSWNEYLS